MVSLPMLEREEVFGRALARVVAHELYHIFVRTVDHSSDGICKSAFSVQELLGDDFQIKIRNMAELRRVVLRSEPAEAAGGTF